MFKLIKFAIAIVVLAGIAYLAFFIPLGDKTFYEHLVGISKTREAKKLGNELEKQVDHTKTEISRTIKKQASKLSKAKIKNSASNAIDKVKNLKDIQLTEHSEKDRSALNDLLKKKAAQGGNDKPVSNRPKKQ